jgi:CRP-like cAMP-binding protein
MVNMAEPITPLPLTSSRADQIFPTLTSAQIARVATHGRKRAVRGGEVLVEQGDRAIPFFVVITGELEAVRPTCATETLITAAGRTRDRRCERIFAVCHNRLQERGWRQLMRL